MTDELSKKLLFRQWQRLPYRDPESTLILLREFAESNPLHLLPYAVRSLRTNELRRVREGRQCALFCHGMSLRLNTKVRFAEFEEGGIDFVARYDVGEEVHFAPLQMKELVPEEANGFANLQAEIDKLSKYVDSADLVVAFHVNRTGIIELSKLDLSKVPVAELWLIGALREDQSRWVLVGNILRRDAIFIEFDYPTS